MKAGDADHVGRGSLRSTGDPAADKLARAVLAAHRRVDGTDDLHRLVGSLVVAGGTGRSYFSDWLQEAPGLPEWAQPQLIAAAQDAFGQRGLHIATALFCASLPTAYAGADGVQVLALASDLAADSHVARRIAETGQFLVDVLAPGGEKPEAGLDSPAGQGFLAVQRVRIFHALVRVWITESGRVEHSCDEAVTRSWCPDWGYPVNQEDLLATLLTFTVVVFAALDRLGASLTTASEEAYLHTWSVVGSLLGIEPSPIELPLGIEEAEGLMATLLPRLQRPSAAGRQLMSVLLVEMERSMPWGLRKVPRTLVRHLASDRVAEILGVPPPAWWAPVLGRLAGLEQRLAPIVGGSAVLRSLSAVLSRSVIRMWIDENLEGARHRFVGNPELLRGWRIQTSGPRRRLRRLRRRARSWQLGPTRRKGSASQGATGGRGPADRRSRSAGRGREGAVGDRRRRV